jgi:hypothetical protein
MAVNKLQLKRSAVPGKVPTTSSLDLGELALNTYDGRAFFKQSGSLTSIVELATVNGSGSAVISASYAATASSADNLLVRGTLTAQTIVVQTVSSSVIYSSGSNRFGNSLANTQVFTGSVGMTGSLTVTGPTTISGFGNNLLTVGYVGNNTNMVVGYNAGFSLQSGWGNGGAFISTTGGTALFLQAGPNNATNLGGVALGYNLGQTPSLGRLQIKGYTSGSNLSTATFYVENLAGSSSFAVYDDSSVKIGGNTTITGSLNVTGSITVSGSVINNLTASQAITASYVPASGVVGLNLSQIATGSVTASVSLDSGSFAVTSGSSTLLFVNRNGNVGINTTTDAGFRLDVNGTARVQGQTIIKNAADAENIKLENRSIDFSRNGGAYGGSSISSTGNAMSLFSRNAMSFLAGGSGLTIFQLNEEITGVNTGIARITPSIGASSGTASVTTLLLRPTNNFTGTYSGIVRGLLYDPINT